MASEIMEEIDFHYDQQYQRYFFETAKRSDTIVLEPLQNTSLVKFRYKTGKDVAGLEGAFSGFSEALAAFKVWYTNTKMSKAKYRNDNFGPESDRPTLKRKKVVKKQNDADSSSQNNE